MPFRVTCTTCGTRFALGDDLYERKIKNRIVTIRCRSCSSDISVDGVALASGAPAEPLGTGSEPVLDSDAVPVAAKVPDLTPTVPLQHPGEKAASREAPAPAGEARAKGEGLWVVCCPEQDDRELTLPEIEAAIAKNEVNGDAIVWRDGMAEWLPIHQVPELRVLLKRPPLPKPKGRTLLGIGTKSAVAATATPKPLPARARLVSTEASDPDNEPVSVEPEPLSQASLEMVAQRKGTAIALSPGLLSVKRADDEARPEPPPRRRMDSVPEPPPRVKMDSKPEPPPRVKMDSVPEPPARPRMDSRPDRLPKAPTPVRAVPKLLLEERPLDSAPDSSGTPNLKSLASVGPKKPAVRNDADKNPPPDEFMWQIGPEGNAGNELLGAPTIDVANLSAAPASDGAEADALPAEPSAESQREPKKSSKKRAKERAKAKPERAVEKSAESPHADAPAPKPETQKKSGVWLLLGGAVVIGAAILLVRGKGSSSETPPEPVPVPTVEPASPPTTTVDPAAAATVPAPVEGVPAVGSQPEKEDPATAGAVASGSPTSGTTSRGASTEATERKPAAERPTEERTAPEPKPATEATEAKPSATSKPDKTAEKPAAPATTEKPAEGAPAAEFDRAAAAAALNSAAAQASACRKEGDPTGAAAVVVTFAPSGRVTSANVNGPPFAGTATGGCIAAAMRRAKVPPFTGSHVTVGKTVPIR